jgi:hypothetical protein
MLGAGASSTLTMPPTVAATTASGRVLTFPALAAETGGFRAAARRSVRVMMP